MPQRLRLSVSRFWVLWFRPYPQPFPLVRGRERWPTVGTASMLQDGIPRFNLVHHPTEIVSLPSPWQGEGLGIG